MKQRQKKHRIGGAVSFVMMVIGIAAVIAAVPAGTLRVFGERAALLSAGLRCPTDGVEILSGKLSRVTAAVTPPTTSTVTVGEGRSEAVTTTTMTVVSGESAGRVSEQQMSVGNVVSGVAIRNKSGKSVDMAQSLKHTPALGLKANSKEPQVLITHTHTTECYLSHDTGVYTADDPTRCTDPAKNMVAVGERVAAELRSAGIGVIHDTEIHDQPYNGAYGHSKAAIQRYLKQSPSIRVVLDLHRDAIYNGTTHIKPTVTIDGKKAAQIMIIVGMLNTDSVPNKHTAENLAFGARLQQYVHRTYEGLARPMLLADARYNQQLTNGSLLIEIGSDANTLEEACYTGELLGRSLSEVLRELGA